MNEHAPDDGSVPVPDAVRSLLAGAPDIGSWNPIFPLLTVDAAGFPHVCLLSRAELDADERRLRAVVAGANTTANLRRSGLATLMLIGGDAAWYCKLRLAEELTEAQTSGSGLWI